jgi:hypothetical protein
VSGGDRDRRFGEGEGTLRRRRWLLTVGGAVFLALATAFASGFGSKLADTVGSSSAPLISSSATGELAGCGPGVFLPEGSVVRALEMNPGKEEVMEELQGLPGFAFADDGRVNVSIQGGSDRVVTLTGISFHVTRGRRPRGALFEDPCGGPTIGRTILFDLDSRPPEILESNELAHTPLGSRAGDGERLTKPIRFPWTVSLTDPLLLALIATTRSECFCTWSAEIPWVSGSDRGVIDVDNGGSGYSLASSRGLRTYGPSFDGSAGWTESPPQRLPPPAL